MESSKIRQQFLEFFRKRGHKVVPSSSLIPDDPSVLFTTAGMQQFKKYYLDSPSPYGNRVASIQKCIRTTDIDQVGDESHLTFFEMLGNFSFKFPEAEDAYFKEEAIKLAYDFILGELKIPLDRIKISVFKGDSKDNIPEDRGSFEIWKLLGVPEDKIIFGDREDNFWGPTGGEGPCGPTTEIHIDGIEVWNIVFNEYYCSSRSPQGEASDKEKRLAPLGKKGVDPERSREGPPRTKQDAEHVRGFVRGPQRASASYGVDTGMGLERLAMVVQGKKSIFETDLFLSLTTELRGKNLYDHESNKRSERIIVDHLKASAFVISDGVMPSNVERGYVLRRLIRKIMRHSKKLNLPEDFLQRYVEIIINIYKEYYPELAKNKEKILEIFSEEFQKFGKALEKGIKVFEQGIIEFKSRGQITIPGAYVFGIQQSMGVTLDIMEDIAKEKKMEIDIKGFQEEEKKHKEISKVSQEKKFRKH